MDTATMTPMAPLLEIILVIIVLLMALAVLALFLCLSIRRSFRGDRSAPVPPSAAVGARGGAEGVDPWRESARRLNIDRPGPGSGRFGRTGGRRG